MQNDETFFSDATAKHTVGGMYAYVICGLAAFFYLYEFVLQVSPGVITEALMRDLSVDAAGLGIVSAFYYYSYAPMQIPAGLLYDRYGARCVLTFAVIICAVGALLFGVTGGIALAAAGRMLMGIGSAFAFIGALVLIARWFPASYFALLAGIAQSLSSVGAMIGEVPLAKAIEAFGWRHSMLVLGVFGLSLALLVYTLVRNSPQGTTPGVAASPAVGSVCSNLYRVCGSTQTWWLGLYSFCIWAPIVAFAALWGVPFLMALYHITAAQASLACSMVWLGIGIGSPLAGWLSDYMRRRCLPLAWVAGLGLVSTLLLLYLPNVSLGTMYLLLFLFGIASSGQSLAFALVRDNNHPSMVGAAVGFNNMAVVLGGALFQPLVGIVLRFNWSGEIVHGVPFYAAHDYQAALTLLPVSYFVAMVVSAYKLKESYCVSKYSYD